MRAAESTPAVSATAELAAERAVGELIERWAHGEPDLAELCARHGGSAAVAAALAKEDLRCRFARGQRPAAWAYLERFPALQADRDRVVSLAYEEYCLRQERGEAPAPEEFCARYEAWRDSLASQLHYHHLLSRAVGPAAAPVRFPEPGEWFRRFHLRSILGQGGAARVYLADDEDLGGRRVALKVSPDRGEEPSILGRLDHAHIVPVLSVAREPETGLRGLCMPYQPGLPLDEVLRRLGPPSARRGAGVLWEALSWPDSAETPPGPGWAGCPRAGGFVEAATWIVAALARALGHAHSRGILHRDVKPANVLLARREGPQLLDFNLAHDPHTPARAEDAHRGGTLPYMAPEQLASFLDPARWDDVGEAADVYALGLVFREILTGRPPEAPDPGTPLPEALRVLLGRRAAAPPSMRPLNPAVPHALDAIVARCLAPAPRDRYPDAPALAEDLQRFLDRRPLRYATNPSRAEIAAHWLRRHRRRIAAALGAAAALAAAVAVADAALRRAAQDRVLLGIGAAAQGRWLEAGQHFDRARRLAPGSYKAHHGLAFVYYHDGRFLDSYREYSRAIGLAEAQGPTAGAATVATLYLNRARSALGRGEQARAARSLPALDEAARRYATALEDQRHARSLVQGDPSPTARAALETDADRIAARAEIGLGDIAAALDRRPLARNHYERAGRLLDAILKDHPRDRDASELLDNLGSRRARLDSRRRRRARTPRGPRPATPGN
ncbi:MAG TPA: protein kinase [Isosphaeraceae bacterium]